MGCADMFFRFKTQNEPMLVCWKEKLMENKRNDDDERNEKAKTLTSPTASESL